MVFRGVWRSLVLSMCLVASASAEYVVGAGDILQVSVWQNEALNREVFVREDGYFTFPPVGDVEAAGLSTEQLGERLSEQLFTYTRSTTKVTITVTEFNSKFVVVSGAVATPGRYTFQTIPSIVRVLGLAGGATIGARLSEVTVSRTENGSEEVMKVNVAEILDGDGDLSSLPPLQAGDVVYVPGAGYSDPQATPGTSAPGPGTISILGAVGRPGTYPAETSFALPEVLGLAGGLAPNADLRSIRVLSRERDGSEFVAELDLEEIFRAGEPIEYPIRPGDAIYVEAHETSFLMQLGRGTLSVLALSRDLANFILLWDVLKDDDETTTTTGN
jgi:polysaccharide export outer membrane protein